MKLYHGTTAKARRCILEQGILPRIHTGINNWKHTVGSSPGAVYLTNCYPLYFAAASRDITAAPGLVLEVDTNRLDQALLAPDEDVLEQAGRGHDHAPGGMAERTLWYRERAFWLYTGRGQWKTSLDAMGTCAYYGIVPATAITRVVEIDFKLRKEVLHTAYDALITLSNYRFVGKKYKALTKWVFGDEPAPEELPLEFGYSCELGRVIKEFEYPFSDSREGIDVQVVNA